MAIRENLKKEFVTSEDVTPVSLSHVNPYSNNALRNLLHFSF